MKIYSASVVEQLIDEYIHNERNKSILKDRFLCEIPFKELEDKYHLSDRQLKRIVKKADTIFIKLLK